MLRHIVMWKFKGTQTQTKDQCIEIAKRELEALAGKVPELKSIRFIKNEVVCDRNFDALLIVETENEGALEAYKVHPEHKKAATFISLCTENRGAVDYWC